VPSRSIASLIVDCVQAFNSTERECVLDGEDSTQPSANESSANGSAANGPATNGSARYMYSLKLKFTTRVFGIFNQTLLLDFGIKPLLAKVRKWRLIDQFIHQLIDLLRGQFQPDHSA
jgi:hypothetical protein